MASGQADSSHLSRDHLKRAFELLVRRLPNVTYELRDAYAKHGEGAVVETGAALVDAYIAELQTNPTSAISNQFRHKWVESIKQVLGKKPTRRFATHVSSLQSIKRRADVTPNRLQCEELAKECVAIRELLSERLTDFEGELTIRLLLEEEFYEAFVRTRGTLHPVSKAVETQAILPGDQFVPVRSAPSRCSGVPPPMPGQAGEEPASSAPNTRDESVLAEATTAKAPVVGHDPTHDDVEPKSALVMDEEPAITFPRGTLADTSAFDLLGALQALPRTFPKPHEWLSHERSTAVWAQARDHASAVIATSNWKESEDLGAAMGKVSDAVAECQRTATALVAALNEARDELLLPYGCGTCHGGPELDLQENWVETCERFVQVWRGFAARRQGTLDNVAEGIRVAVDEESTTSDWDEYERDLRSGLLELWTTGEAIAVEEWLELATSRVQQGRLHAQRDEVLKRADALARTLVGFALAGVKSMVASVIEASTPEDLESAIRQLDENMRAFSPAHSIAAPQSAAAPPSLGPGPSPDPHTGSSRVTSGCDLSRLPAYLTPAEFRPEYFSALKLAAPLREGRAEGDPDALASRYEGLRPRDIHGRLTCARQWVRAAQHTKHDSWIEALWEHSHSACLYSASYPGDRSECRDMYVGLYKLAWDCRAVFPDSARRRHYAAAAAVHAAYLAPGDEQLTGLLRLSESADAATLADFAPYDERLMAILCNVLCRVTDTDDGNYFDEFYDAFLGQREDNVRYYANRLVRQRFRADAKAVVAQLTTVCQQNPELIGTLRRVHDVYGEPNHPEQGRRQLECQQELRAYKGTGGVSAYVSELLLDEMGSVLRRPGEGRLHIQRATSANAPLYIHDPLQLALEVKNTGKGVLRDIKINVKCPSLWVGNRGETIDLLPPDYGELVLLDMPLSQNAEPKAHDVKVVTSHNGQPYGREKTLRYVVDAEEAFTPIAPFPFVSGTPVSPRGEYGELIGTGRHLNRIRELVKDPVAAGVVVLYGRRRRGKTSILEWLAADEDVLSTYHVVLAKDLQDEDERAARMFQILALEIFNAVWSELPEAARGRLDPRGRIDSEQAGVQDALDAFTDWLFRELLPALKRASGSKGLLIMIDEFQSWLEGRPKEEQARIGRVFNRIHQQESMAAILCGLSHLPQLLEGFDLRLRVQYEEVQRLAKEAIAALLKVRDSISWGANTLDYTELLTAGNPFFVVLLGTEITTILNERKRYLATRHDIDEAVDRILQNPKAPDYFGYMVRQNELPERPRIPEAEVLHELAHAIEGARQGSLTGKLSIDEAAFLTFVDKRGFRDANDIRRALSKLESFELISSEQVGGETEYTFRSELARRWLVTPQALKEIPRLQSEDASLLKGRYSLATRIGRGGFAEAWRARDHDVHDRQVVVKILKPDPQDPERQARFDQESAILASINSRHVVKILDRGVDARGHFIVMEEVAGRTLQDWLQEHGAVEPKKARAIVEQIARALEACHEHGIIHKDLKPSNIMLREGAEQGTFEVTLIDFGLAISTETMRVMGRFGTPPYASPELLKASGDVSKPGDVFSLGIVAFELLTGEHAFVPPTEDATDDTVVVPAIRLANVRPLPDAVPVNFRTLVEDMLQKDPTARPSALHVVRRIKSALQRDSSAELRSRALELINNNEFTKGLQLLEEAYVRSPSSGDGEAALALLVWQAGKRNDFDTYRRHAIAHLLRTGNVESLGPLSNPNATFPSANADDVAMFVLEVLSESINRLPLEKLPEVTAFVRNDASVPRSWERSRAELVAQAYSVQGQHDEAVLTLAYASDNSYIGSDDRRRLIEQARSFGRYAGEDARSYLDIIDAEAVRQPGAVPLPIAVEERSSAAKVLKSGEDGHANRTALERFAKQMFDTFDFVREVRTAEWFNGNGRNGIAPLSSSDVEACRVVGQLGQGYTARPNVRLHILLHVDNDEAQVKAAHERLANHVLFSL